MKKYSEKVKRYWKECRIRFIMALLFFTMVSAGILCIAWSMIFI